MTILELYIKCVISENNAYLQHATKTGWAAFDAKTNNYISSSRDLKQLLADITRKGYSAAVNSPKESEVFSFNLSEPGALEKLQDKITKNKLGALKPRTHGPPSEELSSGEKTEYVNAHKPKYPGHFDGQAVEVKDKHFVLVRYIDKETEEERRRRMETKKVIGYWVWRRARNEWMWKNA